ncbi:MAG: twin-arginine translocation signal domain-containing protein, partial [Pseudomonadota bacterium]|nr:twin-arginine translocation signal domain-containing protein [Pseudomonadota bacterium]
MNILKKRSWELPEREATPEAVFMNRRQILAGLAGAGALMGTGLGIRPAFAEEDPSAGLYPV